MLGRLRKRLRRSGSATRENGDELRPAGDARQAMYGQRLPVRTPPVFAIGTGRSGTHFLQCLMEKDTSIASYHIRAPDADSFTQYCAWNKLPVDLEGFLQTRQHWIRDAAALGKICFESNPYLSLSVAPLFERFHGKFVFVVRRPEEVVNSHYVKGWYKETPVRAKLELAVGFQPDLQTNYFFGRIVPHGQEFIRWKQLTRIGKIAWMWNVINLEVLRQLDQLPKEHYILVKLEGLNYARYRQIHSFIGGAAPMPEREFDRIRRERPGKGPWQRTTDTWSERERQEFLLETQQAKDVLRY